MGTWSAAIFGNDTSCEVKEYFFEQYNLDREPQDISEEILAQYNMDDLEERNNVLFALAHCLWQTKELSVDFLSEIKKIVVSGEDLDICKGLGADAKFLRERERALNKFLAEIDTPKEKAKKRVKPPVPVDSVYRNGCCLAFQFEDGQWGVVITVGCEFFKRKAEIQFAQTDIKQNAFPTINDVHKAHLLQNNFDRDSKFTHQHKLDLYGHFLGSKEISRLNPYNESFFTIIGYLPEWKDAYSGSGSGKMPYFEENYEGFESIIRSYFTSRFGDTKRTLETVEEINQIFQG